MTVVLSLHAKSGLETLQSGAGRPPLGRQAWGCHHVSTAFRAMALILSWSRLAVGFSLRLQVQDRPAFLWPISASDFVEA